MEFFKEESGSKLWHNVKIYTERVLMILIVTFAAIEIPRFVDFLNISGSLGAASLGFILPPLYYFKAKNGIRNLPMHIAAFNVFLICFGTFGAIFSLVTSI
jgi:hypothetical protein